MRYRTLGRTGWRVSAIAMGCWGLTGHWGPVAEDEAIRTIHTAIDCGVNLFDTTDSYGLGIGEERVGKAVRDRRDSVYIATKVGNFARHAGSPLAYDTPQHSTVLRREPGANVSTRSTFTSARSATSPTRPSSWKRSSGSPNAGRSALTASRPTRRASRTFNWTVGARRSSSTTA